jgi:two-component system OmpR family response regulator
MFQLEDTMKTVLVVDDTKNIRTLLKTCLELYGYTVLTASNAQLAYEFLTNEDIDLIFLDIKMPEISGTELLKNMRATGINIPVIIMTAFATIKNAVDCTKLGAVAYLQKPFTAEKVKNVLNEFYTSFYNSVDINSYIQSAEENLINGEFDTAFTLLKKALSIDPSSSKVYELLSKLYELKGDLKQANIFQGMSKEFLNYNK